MKIKWYQVWKFESGSRAEYRTEKRGVYPVAIVLDYGNGKEKSWSVYGRNGNDSVATGKSGNLTTSQIEAEKALKEWVRSDE